MNRIAAQLRLRYRPTGDILSGEAEIRHPDFDDAASFDDSIDSDTSVSWSVPSRGDFAGQAILNSFSIIGARGRFGTTDRPAFVSPSVWKTAQSLFETKAPRNVPMEVAITAKAEARRTVDVSDLVRPAGVESSDQADLGVARSLAASAQRLGHHVLDAVDTESNAPASRFGRDMVQFATLLAAHRRPVPSLVTNLQTNLRGGLPFTQSERRDVRDALVWSLDVRKWPDASDRLWSIVNALDHHHESLDDEDE